MIKYRAAALFTVSCVAALGLFIFVPRPLNYVVMAIGASVVGVMNLRDNQRGLKERLAPFAVVVPLCVTFFIATNQSRQAAYKANLHQQIESGKARIRIIGKKTTAETWRLFALREELAASERKLANRKRSDYEDLLKNRDEQARNYSVSRNALIADTAEYNRLVGEQNALVVEYNALLTH
jgi:hypothetical protein